MMQKGLFTQIGMIIIAAVIVFTYVTPKLKDLGKVQEDTQLYLSKKDDVDKVNLRLKNLLAIKDSVDPEAMNRLDDYLPLEIDPIKIQRDIAGLAEINDLYYETPVYDGPLNKKKRSKGKDEAAPDAFVFSLSFTSTYQQLKDFLSMVERNNYPLEVSSLSVAGDESGLLQVNMSFVTYQYHNYVSDNQ